LQFQNRNFSVLEQKINFLTRGVREKREGGMDGGREGEL
jgi:hypothetical protein